MRVVRDPCVVLRGVQEPALPSCGAQIRAAADTIGPITVKHAQNSVRQMDCAEVGILYSLLWF